MLVVVATFGTAALSAIAGFGGGVLLLPVFILVFAVRDAVAVLTVVQLVSNTSRVALNRREVDTRLVGAVGAVSGFGSALLGSVGPMVAPFFLVRGLTRGAYIGTEAAAAIVMHLTKLVVFGAAAVLTSVTLGYGVLLAPASAAGSYVGKRVVDRMPVAVFTTVVEIGLVVAGILLIVGV